jgi:hypothetical protein
MARWIVAGSWGRVRDPRYWYLHIVVTGRKHFLQCAFTELQLGKATLGAKSQAFNLVYGQRLEVAFSLAKPTVVALESLAGPSAQLQFEYAADGFERRYILGGGDGRFEYLALPSGTFRLVFTGDGLSRIRVATTKQSKLQPIIIEGQ